MHEGMSVTRWLVARAYLCDVLEGMIPVGYSGHNKVSRVVMLGSPLVDAVPTRFTATRLAGWIDQHYPGDFYAPDVEYLAVAGRCIEGNRNGLPLQRSAYHVYQFISGNGAQWGDGIVPISLSIPHGMTHLILDGIGHSPSVGHAWYGSNSTVIGTWWR